MRRNHTLPVAKSGVRYKEMAIPEPAARARRPETVFHRPPKESIMTVLLETPLAAWHAAIAAPCQEYVRSQLGNELVDGLLAAVEAAK